MNRGFLRMLCKIAFGSVMESRITNKCVWYEVCGVFEREWTDDVPLSFRISEK